jgi:cell wall-associated NlpC family hydrolase
MRVLGMAVSLLVVLSLWSAPLAEGARGAGDGVDEPVRPRVAEDVDEDTDVAEDAARAWREWLRELEHAGVRLPPARALLDLDRLPPGLRPARGADGTVRRGVAWAPEPGALVVPREVAAVVSGALDAVGAPYADDGGGPDAFSCDGLVHTLYRRVGFEVAESAAGQWATGREVAYEDAVPGDLVVVGSRRYGIQSIGIVVGEDVMVTADARAAAVVVAALPGRDAVLGVVRPSLGPRPARPVPEGEDSPSWRCGGIQPSGGTGASGPAQRGWAGYPNGLIPSGVLCELDEKPHALRCDAARDFAALSEAYADELGESLCLTDSYRTLEMQLDLYRRKPELSATPGTSNHGWGLAVDLCGGVERFGTEEHRWMRAHAPDFGWIHPSWAREGSPREEPWHWEYVGR